jgi:hypothetical protein
MVPLLAVVALVTASAVRSAPGAAASGSAQSAVEKYLEENLDDPDYRVVKWFTPVSVPNSEGQPETVVRLKFRVKGPFGGWTLLDKAFIIDAAGEVRPAHYIVSMFSDDDDQWRREFREFAGR